MRKKHKPYRDFAHWQAQAEAQGFRVSSEADLDQVILTLYRREQSLRKTGEYLKVRGTAVRHHLCRLGEPLRPRGGNNNPTGCRHGLRLITWRGKTQNLAQWARELEISYATLWRRLSRCHWSVEKAFTTPVDVRKRRKYGNNHSIA